MKKIKIRFYGLGYDNKHQAYIKIYDVSNNLIYVGQTYNGQIDVLLNKYSLYHLIAEICNDIIDIYFYTNQEEYTFYFNRGVIKFRTITFLLTDYYYNNLKIERGDLIIWQKM